MDYDSIALPLSYAGGDVGTRLSRSSDARGDSQGQRRWRIAIVFSLLCGLPFLPSGQLAGTLLIAQRSGKLVRSLIIVQRSDKFTGTLTIVQRSDKFSRASTIRAGWKPAVRLRLVETFATIIECRRVNC